MKGSMMAAVSNLRERLESFELCHCEMAHEQMKREADGITPVSDSSSDHGFCRSHYCSLALRSKRLGCAHTTARRELIGLLETLSESVYSKKMVADWMEQIRVLDWKIIQVDWKKSDAELSQARLLAEWTQGKETPSVIAERLESNRRWIEALNQEHSGYVDHLASIREAILTLELDR